MTDKNLASLALLDLIHMLHVAQAHYFTAKNDHEREIIQKQKDEILAAMQTIADALVSGWEFDYSAYVGDALDRLADARILSR